MKKSFKLMSAALIALASFVPAQAETLTVFDGTATSTSVPIEGYYYDGVGCAVQTIIPAADIAAMEGAFINSMKFYIADEGGNKLDGGSMKVSLGTTEKTAFSSYDAVIEGLTHVANITMTAGETEVVINFDTPFNYQGGNLVIETLVESRGNYSYVNFYGVNAEVTNAFLKHNYSNSVDAFYPKTTFEYEVVEDLATLSAQAMAFGQLYLGNEATQSITLKNMGKNAFTPVFGALEAPFSLEVAAAEVAPGASMEIPVKFAPTVVGDYAQTLTIDCGVAGQFNVALTAVGAEVPLEVVVADGMVISDKVPVYGFGYDYSAAGGFGQMIYPAEMLTDLVGQKITSIKFHANAAMKMNAGNMQLSMGVVEQTAFEATTAISDLAVVANGAPVAGETELVFNFNEPILYEGGNLAFEVKVTEAGTYGNDKFLGIEQASASYAHYYDFGFEDVLFNFLPKATFGYQKDETPEPVVVRGDVDGDGVVAIKDVTALIDLLLSGAEAPAGADCDLDGEVAIKDVTALIDYLLGGEWPAPVAE